MYRFQFDRQLTSRDPLALASKSSAWQRIAAFVLVLAFGTGQAMAASYVVDTASDAANLTACTSATKDCSLRGAITNANNAGGSSTISFDSGYFASAKQINLNSDLPAIQYTLAVEGPGTTLLTVDGGNAQRPFLVNTGANLTLENLTIAHGGNQGEGGAIYNAGAAMVIDSILSANSSTAYGGAIVNYGTLVVSGSTVSNNSSGYGGGIANRVGTVKLFNSTVSGNSSAQLGAGLFSAGSTTLNNSTVAGNTAPGNGSGIATFGGGTFNLHNSIIADNNGGSQCFASTSALIAAHNSLIQDNLDCVTSTNKNNLTGDPMLGPLTDNGGPTPTMALQLASPAINAGDNAIAVNGNGVPLSTDQRSNGYDRIANGTVDMGAYEVQLRVVDTASDAANLAACTSASGDCSLRGAITDANSAGVSSVIRFASAVFATAQTINLNSDLPAISVGLIIDGPGAALLSGDGGNAHRPFHVNAGVDVTLENLTITYGNAGSNPGGGIYNDGNLSVIDSVVTNNATAGSIAGGGGGIFSNGTLVVKSSTVSNNTSVYFGGGLYNGTGEIEVINSTLAGNSAAYGGGIFNGNNGTMTNSTVANNSATSTGDGIYSSNGAFELNNTIVAGSTSVGDCYNSATLNAQNSLVEDGTCGVTNGTNGNLTGDPMLSSLADNGGPTQTMALHGGSPAIDAGDNVLAVDQNANPLGNDQRGAGFTRIVTGTVDMGAYEFVDTSAPVVTSFAATPPTNTLAIPITAFSASDNVGVTGYLITESATPPSASDPGWSAAVPASFSVASDGNFTLYPWARDASGNVSAVYASPANVDVDTSAPSLLSFSRQDPSAQNTNADSLTVRAAFSEAVQNVDATDFVINGSTTATVTAVTAVDAQTFDIDVSGGDLASFNGSVGLDLAAGQDIQDSFGNALPAGEPASDETWMLDNSPPAAPSVPDLAAASDSGISDTDNITHAVFPTLQGSAEEGASVTLSSSRDGVLGSTVANGGNWTFTPTSPMSDGDHALTATATDAAGNASTASAALNVTIDTIPPAGSISSSYGSTVNAPFAATVNFAEAVNGFTLADITSSNASLSTLAGSGATYTVTVIPTGVDPSTITLNVGPGVVHDTAGLPNIPGPGFSIDYDTSVAGPLCYVNQVASGGNSGAPWVDAYTDLQSALTSPRCSEVWVALGIYKPVSGTDRSISFNILPEVAVYGGFAGTEMDRSARDPVANITVLSGDIGSVDDDSDNSYHVVVMHGTTGLKIVASTVLDGFTVTGGAANDSGTQNFGGGLYCNGANSGNECSPSLSNLIFSGNKANYGGAMYNDGHGDGTSSPTLSNVSFSGNSAEYGGAMINVGFSSGISSPILSNVTFDSNTASVSGGAMVNSGDSSGTSSPILSNVTFSGNSATNHNGGAMVNDGENGGTSIPTLRNVTFNGNSAGIHSGGAMYNKGEYGGISTPILINVIMWGDTATGSDPEISNDAGSGSSSGTATPIIDHSVVQGSGGSTSWDASLGTDGGGNIDADPLLGPLGDNGGTTLTMAPSPASPAIDTGNDATCGDPNTVNHLDQRGVTRPQGPHCDIGAVEFVDLIFADGFDVAP